MSSVDVYPEYAREAPPEEFGEEVEAGIQEIDDACAGWGTDETALVEALCGKTPQERYNIICCFTATKDRPLKAKMKAECGSGDFGLALQFAALTPFEAESKMIREAVSGVGARENILYPILCGRSNAEMTALKQSFFDCYGDDLAVTLNSELGGQFEDFINFLLQADEEEYDEEVHTAEKAEEDADKFYEEGQGDWFGTDEKAIYTIITKSPTQHLKNINTIYEAKYGKTLEKALDSELGGDVEKATRFHIRMKLEPYHEASRLIDNSCRGFGTNELLLTCCLIRYQNWMSSINDAHMEMCDGEPVADRVGNDVGGNYKTLCLKLIEVGLGL